MTQQRLGTVTVAVSALVPAGLVVCLLSGCLALRIPKGRTNQVSVVGDSNDEPAFVLYAPAELSVIQGDSVLADVSFEAVSGFAEDVTVSLLAPPPGIGAEAILLTTATPSEKLSISVSANVPAGDIQLSVSGQASGGVLSRIVTVVLHVSERPSSGFSLTSPGEVVAFAGAPAHFSVGVVRTTSFDPLALSLVAAPPGVSASDVVIADVATSANVTLDVPAALAAGHYTLIVRATRQDERFEDVSVPFAVLSPVAQTLGTVSRGTSPAIDIDFGLDAITSTSVGASGTLADVTVTPAALDAQTIRVSFTIAENAGIFDRSFDLVLTTPNASKTIARSFAIAPDVRGRLLYINGVPVSSGIIVRSGSVMTTTASDGKYVLPGVVPPYDLMVIPPTNTPALSQAWMYVGVQATNLSLGYFYTSPLSKNALLNLTLRDGANVALALGAGSPAALGAEAPVVAASSILPSAAATNPPNPAMASWFGPTSAVSAVLAALSYRIVTPDPTCPLGVCYDLYGDITPTLTHAATLNADLVLGNTLFTGNIEGDVSKPAALDAALQVNVYYRAFGRQRGIALPAPGLVLQAPSPQWKKAAPVSISAQYDVLLTAKASDNSRLVSHWQPGISVSGFATVAPAITVPDGLVYGAMPSCHPASAYTWSAFGAGPLYELDIDVSGASNRAIYHVITAGLSASAAALASVVAWPPDSDGTATLTLRARTNSGGLDAALQGGPASSAIDAAAVLSTGPTSTTQLAASTYQYIGTCSP
ncbi:MAG: hypothetical protein IT381_19700 [Deltaproteobacteria bacterium]|nr:hypothetical protein [Deltaproteobacteria bacterium]